MSDHPYAGIIVRFVLLVFSVTTATAVYDVISCERRSPGNCEAQRAVLAETSTRVPSVLFAWLADSPTSGQPSAPRTKAIRKKPEDPRLDPKPLELKK
jgi:hypothetical protein